MSSHSGDEDKELEKLIREIKGEGDASDSKEKYGPIEGTQRQGKRILIVDDLWEIIADFSKSDEKYRPENDQLSATFHFFRIGDKDGARFSDCLGWIRSRPPFDAIYVDGDLGDQGSGPDLISHIRRIPGLEYQAAAVVTAEASFFTRQSRSKAGTRLMGKFDLKGPAAIRKFVTDIPDLEAQSRELFWAACQSELADALDRGVEVREAAEAFGARLTDRYDVCAWYLRDLRGKTLDAIAMHDYYGAGEQLPLEKAPSFQLQLLGEERAEGEPWEIKNNLSSEEAGARPDMIGHHAILARVGSTLAGGVKAVLSAYRENGSPEFFDSDARNLYHIAIAMRLALATQRVNARLEALAQAIETVLTASSTGQITDSLCSFLHDHIQEPLEHRGHSTKTTARLFLRGGGLLARWGEGGKQQWGSLPTFDAEPISITEDCVYSRAIDDNRIKWSQDADEKGKTFRRTTKRDVKSYVTVPLSDGESVIGAINLESVLDGAYKPADISLMQAVGRVATAAILNHRSQRFMAQLAQLTSLAVNPAAENGSNPDEILDQGAAILYELCGYSDFLLYQAPADLEGPWQILKAWQGVGPQSSRRHIDTLAFAQKQIDENWNKTFLKSCLDKKTETTFIGQNEEDGLRDDGQGNLRPEGRTTKAHVVVVLRETNEGHRRAVMLLFEHRRPIPVHFKAVLEAFATFLNTIYSTTFSNENVGRALTAARIEARAGRVNSQVRHSITSHLVSIFNAIDLGRKAGKPSDLILNKVLDRLHMAHEEFEASRILLKQPELVSCDIAILWSNAVSDLKSRIDEANLQVYSNVTSLLAETDPKLITYILFNLIDNAIVHGKSSGVTRIWFEALDGVPGCAVCDDGTEIKKIVASKMFEMGVTTKSTGTGQGLHMAREIAADLKGRLDYVRRDGANCFELKLAGEN